MKHVLSATVLVGLSLGLFALSQFEGSPSTTTTEAADLDNSSGKLDSQPTENSLKPGSGTTAPSLVVHEWGTFTSVSGSDGMPLKFQPLVSSDLPGFVYSLADYHGPTFRKRSLTAFQRMETPVTYFYTPEEMDVRVRVDFPNGLLTEFYPPADRVTPDKETTSILHQEFAADPHQSQFPDAMLDWGRLHLIPTDRLIADVADRRLARRIALHTERTIVPQSLGKNHYTIARNTDSALVQKTISDGSDRPTMVIPADYLEKFLFYRGVSNFESTMAATAAGEGQFEITNHGEQPVTSLFLVSLQKNQMRFRKIEQIQGGQSVSVALSAATQSTDQLTKQVVQALEQEGLYLKEAQAMVDTWTDSWFGEPGTRLFYVLPQQRTDALLPLHIEPTPRETTRVMVGRLEILTPEREQQAAELVLSWLDSEHYQETHDQLRDKYFASLGRWLKPLMARVAATSDNDRIQAEAHRIAKFHPTNVFGGTPPAEQVNQ